MTGNLERTATYTWTDDQIQVQGRDLRVIIRFICDSIREGKTGVQGEAPQIE